MQFQLRSTDDLFNIQAIQIALRQIDPKCQIFFDAVVRRLSVDGAIDEVLILKTLAEFDVHAQRVSTGSCCGGCGCG